MKHFVFFALFFIYTCLNAQSAQWHIRGLVTDESGVPLSGASVLADEREYTVTDSFGFFDYKLSARPKYVSVRMLGYFAQRINLDTIRWKNRRTTVQFSLVGNDITLSEVTIAAKPVEIVFQEDNSSDLIDYQFAGNHLLMLVKERKKCYVRLVTEQGHVISEMLMPDTEMQRLYRSCTGAFHAVGTTSAWEVTLHHDQPDTFPRYPVQNFYRYVEPCAAVREKVYFYKRMGPFNQSVRYYYIDGNGKKGVFAEITNTAGEEEAFGLYQDFKSRRPFMLPRTYAMTGALPPASSLVIPTAEIEITSPFSPAFEAIQSATSLRQLVTEMGYDDNNQMATLSALEARRMDSVYAPLIVLRDSVFLFDFVKNKMIKTVSTDNGHWVIREMSFHFLKGWQKQVIPDATTQRAYGRFFTNKEGMILREINLNDGSSTKDYELKDVPYLAHNFQMRNGLLYFIGQPLVTNPNCRLYKINVLTK